jgi:hypothetical protein
MGTMKSAGDIEDNEAALTLAALDLYRVPWNDGSVEGRPWKALFPQ